MTSDQVYIGLSLTLALAAGSQVLATRLRIPMLIILLPVGFIAGWLTGDINPTHLFGASFQPMVSLAVAVILYDSGLGLDLSHMRGDTRSVVVRLLLFGVPLTWLAGAALIAPLFGVSQAVATMFGAILVVSGPTVVGPLLGFVRPVERLRRVLAWEGSLIDPIGALLGAVVFHAVTASTGGHLGKQLELFAGSIGIGIVGGLVGVGLLWLLLCRMRLSEVLGTAVQLAAVVAVAGACDVIRADTGLIAAIMMGLAVANIEAFNVPARRAFFEVLVQLVIGVLFISISATVTPQSVAHLIVPALVLVAALVLAVRPVAALLSTLRTTLSRGERGFVGWMAPRGIVAAATASTFAPALAADGLAGADKILPGTFLVIMLTVTVYGLTAAPMARWLRVASPTAARPLIVGGEPWVVDLGQALRATGVSVLMWAESGEERTAVADAGLDMAQDDLIAEATGKGAEIEGVTGVFLLTDENGFNAVAATLLQGGVGGPVYRIGSPADALGVTAAYAGGRLLFSTRLSRDFVLRQYGAGARITAGEDGGAVPAGYELLFRVRAGGELAPVAAGESPEARPGDRTILLGPVAADIATAPGPG